MKVGEEGGGAIGEGERVGGAWRKVMFLDVHDSSGRAVMKK